MEFRLLGPFEARHGGTAVQVGTRRQERLLLGLLLLEVDRVYTVERLADLMWNGAPPASARGAIQTYVGRLRRTLAPHGIEIQTAGDGYRIRPGAFAVDTEVFAGLVRVAAATGDPGERVRCYDEALALWRGPLLEDVADDQVRRRLDPALDETRMSTAELRAEAYLAMGLDDRVVAEAGPLADAYPTRERLAAAVMTALYRTGRQADALARYRRTRAVLVGELGLEPGRDLQRLHARMLRADSALTRPDAPVYAVRVDGVWLPWAVGGHPALEFCNTYAGWGGPVLPAGDWLRDYRTLAVWSGHHGLVDPWTVTRLCRSAQAEPDAAGQVLEEARRLRADLYSTLVDPDDATAFARLAVYVDAAARSAEFRLGDDGLAAFRPAPGTGLRLPVHAVAHRAAALLADPRRFAVCACPAPECGWLFLDRAGRRRFCSVATCGRSEPEPVVAS